MINFLKRRITPGPVKVQPVTLDILPSIDYETMTVKEFVEYLTKLTRMQLMELEDRKIPEHLWDYHADEISKRSFPDGFSVSEIGNVVLWNKENLQDTCKKLVKQVDGIQKKLDLLSKLVEDTEITMSAKTALRLMQ